MGDDFDTTTVELADTVANLTNTDIVGVSTNMASGIVGVVTGS